MRCIDEKTGIKQGRLWVARATACEVSLKEQHAHPLLQIHLPITTRGAAGASRNTLNGLIGIAYEDIDELSKRLASIEPQLKNTSFAWEQINTSTIHVTDPLGNKWVAEQQPPTARDIRGHHPGGISLCLGITYIEFCVPLNTSASICEYYRFASMAYLFASCA